MIADSKLAYARLLFGVELLATDFSEQAIAAKQFDGANLGRLECASGVSPMDTPAKGR